MDYRTEHRLYRELDDDEIYYATAPIDDVRRELGHYGVRVKPAIVAVRALIDARTSRVWTVSTLNPETTYLQHLESIERIAADVARRGHLNADETGEFVQIVRVRLFEDDYEIIRKFEGRSRFSTYLTTVILRLFHQWRVEQWGKWRPSATARALGEKAIILERLLNREGYSFSEAVAALTRNDPENFSVEQLEAIYARLPLRQPRPVLLSDDNVLAELSSADSAEERVRAREREIAGRAAVARLDRAMGRLNPEDRLILQLRFWNGRKVPEIARIAGLEPRKVYSRLERLFKALRQALQDAGIDHAVVGDLLDGRALELSLEPRPDRTSTSQTASGRKVAGSNGAG